MLQRRSYGSAQITSVDLPELLRSLRERAAKLRREHPEVSQAFLFGSFSRGDFTPESDVDLLLVIEPTDVPFLERADPYRSLFADLPFDVFPVVYTSEEFTRLESQKNPFLLSALEHAVRLDVPAEEDCQEIPR